MNHLEPLSWPVPSQGDGLVALEPGALQRHHLAAILSLSVRSTFRVIATYLDECRQPVPKSFLAGSVRAARELGRITFELAVEGSWIGEPLRTMCATCLDDLDRMAASLSAGEHFASWELTHALDNLIVLLVRLEGAAEAQALTCADRSLAGESRDSRNVLTARRVRVQRDGAASLVASGC